jgi:hypothetical protein
MPVVSVMAAGSSSSASTGVSVPLLVAAAVVAVAWFAVLLLVTLARRPPHIHAGPSGIDVPPEPPAVAGLLVGGFVVPAETAPAILLDLAARHVVDLEEVQPGQTVCRLRTQSNESLTAAEQRVLAAVRHKAVDGVVPAAALSTGTEDQSSAWHRALAKDVIADAQERGLTHDRWPARLLTVLSLFGVTIGVLLFLSLRIGGEDVSGDRAVFAGVAGAIALGIMLIGFGYIGRLGRSLAQLPTAEGRTVAAHVAGLATLLRGDTVLADLPPAAVILRGRHLAYAAAFGAAPHAVALLPMGREDDHRAWSNFGGRWRRVRVHYPRALPPAWGKHPGVALTLALFWGVVAAAAIWGLVQLSDASRPAGISTDAWDWVGRAALLALIPIVLVIAWAIWVVVRAVPDLWSRRTVTGEIVRRRRYRQVFKSGNSPKYWYYLAVDDGSGPRVSAWRVRAALWQAHSQDESVTAEMTPRLRYVRALTKSAAPDAGSGGA